MHALMLINKAADWVTAVYCFLPTKISHWQDCPMTATNAQGHLCNAVQHIDNLPREKAFFKGPAPLLLSSLSPDDLTFLLLGSDPKTSQACPTQSLNSALSHWL